MRADYFNPRAHEGHDSDIAWIHRHQPISIHVPTRGTTNYSQVDNSSVVFQSTCPRGARHLYICRLRQVVISIHVPTRGTTCIFVQKSPYPNFNPRAHEGHDTATNTHRIPKDFNPRAHEGHDPQALSGDNGVVIISIHVPTRGTTTDSSCPAASLDFNPRAHEGHDGAAETLIRYFMTISIHVPTRGTTFRKVVGVCVEHFNPRAHEGHDGENT